MFETFNLNRAYQFLLVLLAFLLPLTVFGANLIIVIIVLIWLLSGDYATKFRKTVNSILFKKNILSTTYLLSYWRYQLQRYIRT